MYDIDTAKKMMADASAKLKDAKKAYKDYDATHPDWEMDDATSDKGEKLYDAYDAYDNLVDALDDYIYEYNKLEELNDKVELALVEVESL